VTYATTITAGWRNSPRTFEPSHQTHDDRPVWKIDGVYVSVDGGKLSVEPIHRSATPEMRIEVHDGELRLPLEDLVPQVLDRLDVADLAQMICADEGARRVILDALARRYNEMGVEDADRRHWLAAVQSEVHDKKLDELTYAMTRIEHAVAQMGYRAMGDIHYDNVLRHELERAGLDAEAALERSQRFRPNQHLVDFKPYVATIGHGQDAWNDARDYWRSQLATLFPHVEVPAAPAKAEVDWFAEPSACEAAQVSGDKSRDEINDF
jgi:hypothetical protein